MNAVLRVPCKGHGAGNDNAFPRKFGPCIARFIESGAKQPPCN